MCEPKAVDSTVPVAITVVLALTAIISSAAAIITGALVVLLAVLGVLVVVGLAGLVFVLSHNRTRLWHPALAQQVQTRPALPAARSVITIPARPPLTIEAPARSQTIWRRSAGQNVAGRARDR
jgi:hypothetical protein